jgi:hypothetical protein
VNRVGGAQIQNRAVQGAVGNVPFVFHGSGTIHRQVRFGDVRSVRFGPV